MAYGRQAPHTPPHDASVRSISWRAPACVNVRQYRSNKYTRTQKLRKRLLIFKIKIWRTTASPRRTPFTSSSFRPWSSWTSYTTMNPEETKYTSDQCLPGANNKANITNLSENLRWLMLNISAGRPMPDFRLRYWRKCYSLSALMSNVVGLTGFQSAQKNDR